MLHEYLDNILVSIHLGFDPAQLSARWAPSLFFPFRHLS